jgi:hypothetical protein
MSERTTAARFAMSKRLAKYQQGKPHNDMLQYIKVQTHTQTILYNQNGYATYHHSTTSVTTQTNFLP